MSEPLVLRADAEGVATLTLNRPDKLNALTVGMFRELRSHVAALAGDDHIACVVLRGAGKCFSAGHDLADIATGEAVPSRGWHSETLRLMEKLPKPVIAAVHGHCYTGALEVALACDFIVASETARFGDTRWALVAEVPTAEAFAAIAELKAMNRTAMMRLLASSVAVLVLTIVAVTWYAKRMRAPIQSVLDTIEVAARGDLTSTLAIDSRNEIGRMATRFGELMHSLRDSLGAIKEQGRALKASSTDLTGVAGDIAAEITQMNEKTHTVSSSTNQMSGNIASVAAAVEETSSNIENVAAAVEEMSTNLSAVSENMEGMVANVNAVAGAVTGMSESLGSVEKSSTQAAEIATRAASAAEQTNRTMQKLGDAAQQIGKVVGVINDIAEQTNLLALNAAIEAHEQVAHFRERDRIGESRESGGR